MYLENRKPPIIIVTPRISDATLMLGVFGFFTCIVLGFACVVLGFTCVDLEVTCVFGLGLASAFACVVVTIGAL